jgi:hypothetical protein
VSTERIPRGTAPPNLARRGEIATKTQQTQTSTICEYPAEPCAPAVPLAHFGTISGVCDGGGVVRTDHHDAGEGSSGSTQQHDLEVRHASVGGW